MDTSEPRFRTNLAVLCLGIIAVDQTLKRWVDTTLPMLKRWPILGQETVMYSRVHNLGLIGDRFSVIPIGYIEPWTRYLPTACFVLLLGFVLFRLNKGRKNETFLSATLLAGSASNLFDSWRQHWVVDSLQLYVGEGTYIPFNLADLAICVGASGLTLLLVYELFTVQELKKG